MAGHTDLNILIVVIVPSGLAHFLIALPVCLICVNLVNRKENLVNRKENFLPKVLT